MAMTASWQRNKLLLVLMITLFLLILLSAPFSVLSQEPGFTPSLEINFLQDNNIYRTQEETSDTITTIAPQFVYNELYGKQTITAEYIGKYAFFADKSSLNYFNHDLSVKALLDHGYSLSTEFSANYQYIIEEPGLINAPTIELTEFIQQSNTSLSAKVLYGGTQSKGQIVVDYMQRTLSFDNNGQQFRDQESDSVTGTFFYRAAPNTRILLEASAVNMAFKNNVNFDQSNEQKTYSVGIEWNATAVTSSVFKIGYLNADFANDSLADLSGLSYFLDTSWKPNTFTTFSIGASRVISESAEQFVGGFLTNTFNVGVDHEITRKTSLFVGYDYNEFEVNNQQFIQEAQNINVTLKYQSKSWLQLQLGYKEIKRESNLQLFDFDAKIMNAGVVMLFDE
jgi:hypothetical protein